MSSNDVRKGMTNAQFNEKQSGILMTEIFIIAVVCGLYFTSWWVFGGVLLGLIIGLFIPQVAIPFIILLSVGWGAVGYGIGSMFGSTGASIVLGVIGLLAGVGSHLGALQWAKDVGNG